MSGTPLTTKEIAFLETASKQDELRAGYPAALLKKRLLATVLNLQTELSAAKATSREAGKRLMTLSRDASGDIFLQFENGGINLSVHGPVVTKAVEALYAKWVKEQE